MSSAEIRSLLNVSSTTHVDQLFVCAPESLRSEAQSWARKFASHATNDVWVLLCDSMCQDQEPCGKWTFRHFGAFRKD